MVLNRKLVAILSSGGIRAIPLSSLCSKILGMGMAPTTSAANGVASIWMYLALPLIMADRLTHLLLDPHSQLKEKNFPRAVRYLKSREEDFYPESYWKALESWQP